MCSCFKLKMQLTRALRQTAAKILMCEPSHFGVTYAINPWMNHNEPVDKSKALQQWEKLKATLEKCGAQTAVMKGEPGLPDLVFTANAGLVFKNKVWLSSFHYKERKPEIIHNDKWFKENGFETFVSKENSFEGAGDALFAGTKLFAGHGFRTQREIYEEVQKKMLSPEIELLLCTLIDEHFYHIDTCFCPLNSELAMFYPEAFNDKSKDLMKNKIELIPVPKEEAGRLACNMVVVGKNVVLHEGNEKTNKLIESVGFTPHPVDVSEFIKAGGACKCLTLRIN